LFLTIVSVLDAPREEVQVLFGHKKQQVLPLDPTCLELLNVQSLVGLP